MGRKKVKLAYIACDSKRRETFRKRKNGIKKKLYEITTLCGIDACAIIYANNNLQEEVWPSDSGVRNVLSKFESLPRLERNKNLIDQEVFLRKSIDKANDKLRTQRQKNKELEMAIVVNHYIHTKEFNGNRMNKYDLKDLSSLIDENLRKINRKMKELQIKAQEQVGSGNEVMNETNEHENIGHVQEVVSGGDNQLANMGQLAQEPETNLADDLQVTFEDSPDLSMLGFSNFNVFPNRF